MPETPGNPWECPVFACLFAWLPSLGAGAGAAVRPLAAEASDPGAPLPVTRKTRVDDQKTWRQVDFQSSDAQAENLQAVWEARLREEREARIGSSWRAGVGLLKA